MTAHTYDKDKVDSRFPILRICEVGWTSELGGEPLSVDTYLVPG